MRRFGVTSERAAPLSPYIIPWKEADAFVDALTKTQAFFRLSMSPWMDAAVPSSRPARRR